MKKKTAIVLSALALVLVLTGPAAAVFECPWTPVSGNNPSADGDYGCEDTSATGPC